jgi:hypothetical protein
MNGNMKIFVLLFLFVALISLACGSVRSVFPTPIYTPRPTTTQSSVDSPRPTIIPGVLVCSDIVTAHEGMTSSQWKEYISTIKGKEIFFSGNYGKAFANGSVAVDNDVNTGSCGFTLYGVPHDIAIGITKGQQLEGYGILTDAEWFVKFPLLYVNVKDLSIVR